MTIQKNNSVRYCSVCKCELILGTNWTEARKKHRAYICKYCQGEKTLDWRIANPKKAKEIERKATKKYQEKNPKKVQDAIANWRTTNPDYMINWTKANPNYYGDWVKTHPENIRKNTAKSHAKRGRDLDWIPMFENPFADLVDVEWHHIDNEYVVAIPKELHHLYGSSNRDKHREGLMYIVNQIYVLNKCKK